MTNVSQLQSVTVEAKVIRKDGTVEDLGEVAAWHRNPFLNAFKRALGRGTVTTTKEK